MMWLYLLALALIGVVVVILIGKWEGSPAPQEEAPAAASDPVDELLASTAGRPLDGADLGAVEFDSAVRGYRMDQVDKLLAALAAQLPQNTDAEPVIQPGDRFHQRPSE